MAREYQPRRFFRNAPNLMLQRYFAARNVLYDVDFTALTETQVHPIYGAWLTLPEVARNETEQTLQFDMMVMLSTHGAGTTTSAPIFEHLPQRAAQAARALLSGTDLTV
jgi:hypothetical protein